MAVIHIVKFDLFSPNELPKFIKQINENTNKDFVWVILKKISGFLKKIYKIYLCVEIITLNL